MCDNHRLGENKLNTRQFHPILQRSFNKQMTAYVPVNQHVQRFHGCGQTPINEEFIDWDDPYKNIRFWTFVDFLRGFKLTK